MKIDTHLINADFSGALIEIDGDHGKIKCIYEDRIYFIINGNGRFIINDNESKVEADDVIIVTKDTPYNIIDKMKFFMICSPEFNPDDDVHL